MLYRSAFLNKYYRWYARAALIAFFMGGPASGGQPTPIAAILIVVPPILVVAIAILAIRCSEWRPQLQVKLVSWYHQSSLSCGRKRSGSDPADSCTNSEPSVAEESSANHH